MTDKEANEFGFSVAGFIPVDEWNQRFDDIMSRCHGRLKAGSIAEAKELHKLHNDKFRPTFQYGGCGSCTQQMFKRMEQHYELRNKKDVV